MVIPLRPKHPRTVGPLPMSIEATCVENGAEGPVLKLLLNIPLGAVTAEQRHDFTALLHKRHQLAIQLSDG